LGLLVLVAPLILPALIRFVIFGAGVGLAKEVEGHGDFMVMLPEQG
jgi:hypothetical protein